MKILNVELLGDLIVAKRKRKKISQVEFGKALGVSFRTIYHREKKPGDYTLSELKRLSIILDEDPVELIKLATKEV